VGHGASRELGGGEVEVPALGPEHASKLDAALGSLDGLDPRFKEQRDEERTSQLTKAWHRLGSQIDADLRLIAKSVIASHQISLDVGSEGGGIKARPWMEETGGALERLYLGLDADGRMLASVGGRTLGTCTLPEVNYAWLEQVVVDWIVDCVRTKQKTLAAAAAAPRPAPAPPTAPPAAPASGPAPGRGQALGPPPRRTG
jgi:hypothetical protein